MAFELASLRPHDPAGTIGVESVIHDHHSRKPLIIDLGKQAKKLLQKGGALLAQDALEIS